MSRRISFTLILFLTLPAFAQSPHKPNVELYLYRRCYTTDERVSVRLSGYNVKSVQFTVHRLDLASAVRTSKDLEDFGKRLKALNVSRLRAVKSWSFGMGRIYPDNWEEREVKAPSLPAGVYLLRARGGGVEKRTWFAVTDVALLTKQSRQELLLFATRARSGQPVTGLSLTLTDEDGKRLRGATDKQGVWRVPVAQSVRLRYRGNLWVYGQDNGHPAFVLSSPPPAPEPFAVYAVTDRPIYRPSHKVLFKGTVRQRLASESPGGFTYRPYADKKVVVEIRDATDALVHRREVNTNRFGSFGGEFQLASEPTLGRWQLIVVVDDGERHGVRSLRAYSDFEVQAYRKPEYTVSVRFERSHYLGGSVVPVTIDARYYFGQPVVDVHVRYNVSFQPDGSGQVEPPFEGQGVTDARGQLKLEIKTQRRPLNRRLVVNATVTDLSRRSQSASGSTLITAGLFRLFVETDKHLYRPNERVIVTVRAEDYDGKPVSTKVAVRLIETKYDRERRRYEEKTTRETTTDAKGAGSVAFTPPRPGYLRLEAEAFDSEDNKILTTEYVWIAGDEYEGYDYPTLNLVAERTTYKPGEVATVLLNTSLVSPRGVQPKTQNPKPKTYKEAWALVTLEGERLYRHQLVHLTSRSTVLRVPLEEVHFPSVQLNVAVVQEKHIYEQQLQLEVPREQHKLQVNVTSDKDRYEPGEQATYTVTTRDYQGKPVSAELALGVVDASIYAIRPDNAPNVVDFFYGGQEVRVETNFSFAAQYSGGAFQTMPREKARQAPTTAEGVRIRRLFADTAYWNPFLVTDESGTAKVTFNLPDNLTTWRATARGITLDTVVGSATHDAIATMPLLVRLELPRFYVRNDEAVVSAVVHNYSNETRTVRARIEATGATLQGDAQRTLQLVGGGQQRLDWNARITDAARVRFLVVADGGQGAQDAMELTLPVHLDGLKMVEATATSLETNNATHRLNVADMPRGTICQIALSPSIASALFDALDFLTSYPYGCAEQTMSSFLPDVIVARTLRRLNVQRKVHPNLDQWVNLGLQKLYRYQHGDGGWNWWEFDQTDGDMTAYVLWGLMQAKEAGYLVDDQRILRGTEALLRLLENERELGKRADWMLTLSHVRPERIAKPLAELFAKRDKLDTHAQASLCLALGEMGKRQGTTGNDGKRRDGLPSQAEFRQMAVTIVSELEAKAIVRGTTAHWSAEEGGYSWRSDDVEVTARVLRALLTVSPTSRSVQPAVRWLMGNRRGKAWSSTKSSAEAVFALAQFLEQTKELQPEFTARVMLDGQTVREFSATARNVFDAPVTLTFTPEQLRGRSALVIDKRGVGTLYVSTTFTYTLPADEAKPMSKGISVRRFFRVTAEDPSQADTVSSGKEVEVEIEITADANYRYAILEDPIPAGCEVAPTEDISGRFGFFDSEGRGGFARLEVRDDKVVFFFNDLRKGRTRLTYRLHAETPGVYRVLPSAASLMYFPEVRGNSGLVRAKIGESTGQ